MENLAVKFSAVTLVLSMMISVASCGKNPGKNVRKVSEDSPWFDANIIESKPVPLKKRVLIMETIVSPVLMKSIMWSVQVANTRIWANLIMINNMIITSALFLLLTVRLIRQSGS